MSLTMTARIPVLLLLAAACVVPPAVFAQESGLDRARVLFRQNRWAEAREAVESELDKLPPNERDQAQLLLGLSQVKEAELYRGLSLFASQVGLDYMTELAAGKENRNSKWLPLFTGLYQLAAGRGPAAEKTLAAALGKPNSPVTQEWSERARERLAAGRGVWPGGSPEALLSGHDLDVPDVADGSDPEKELHFFDPLWLQALERVAWERAAAQLTPLAERGNDMPNKFARYYAGLSHFYLGQAEDAVALLGPVRDGALGPAFAGQARLLIAAASWGSKRPDPAKLAELWEATKAFPQIVLLWKDLEGRGEWSGLEPFASELAKRLSELPNSWPERPDEVMVGLWGLAALGSGLEPSEVLHTLSRHRNHANKNKIEWNDPLLLVALSAANYDNNDYAQALETLFELSKTFSGLRGLQWNLQGVYAARQKAAGDARIAN